MGGENSKTSSVVEIDEHPGSYRATTSPRGPFTFPSVPDPSSEQPSSVAETGTVKHRHIYTRANSNGPWSPPPPELGELTENLRSPYDETGRGSPGSRRSTHEEVDGKPPPYHPGNSNNPIESPSPRFPPSPMDSHTVYEETISMEVTTQIVTELAPDRLVTSFFNGNAKSGNPSGPSCSLERPPKYERMHSGRLAVCVDAELPLKTRYRLRDMILTLWSIVTYLWDYVTDWVVAAGFYYQKDFVWFWLTTAFIVVPHLVMTGFSLAWYLQDHKHHPKAREITPKQWIVRMVILVLQLAPVMRYVDSLRYGYKFRNSDRTTRLDLYESLCFENADAAMLRLFEAFMEAAPQLVLQLYILARKKTNDKPTDFLQVMQVVSIFASWFSLATAMASFHRAQRFSQHNKARISVIGSVLQFVWHLFVFQSRVIAMALFASRFTYWGPVMCGIHVVVMMVWVATMRTSFCPEKWLEAAYNVAVGCLYLFAFLNVKDTPTRWKYCFYYSLYYAENVCLIVLWYIYTKEDGYWFSGPAVGAVVGGFWIGIAVMGFYYYFLHPDKGVWIRKRQYFNTPASPDEEEDAPTWVRSVVEFCL